MDTSQMNSSENTVNNNGSMGLTGNNSVSYSNDHRDVGSVFLVDWEVFTLDGGVGIPCAKRLSPGAEIMEFSWVIYDVAAGVVTYRERRWIRPSAEALATPTSTNLKHALQDAQINVSDFESSSNYLANVLNEFNSSVESKLHRDDGRTNNVAICVYGGERRGVFLEHARRDTISFADLKSAFGNIFDLKTLLRHYYPQLSNHELTTPPLLARRLLNQAYSEDRRLAGLEWAETLALILKRMNVDGFPLSPDMVTVVDVERDSYNSSNLNDSSLSGETSQTDRDTTASYVLRLRGLPWDCTNANIIEFFSPVCEMKRDDVHLVYDYDGNAIGEAFVEIGSLQARDRGLRELHGQNIGKRWIEVFKSTDDELKRYIQSQPGGWLNSKFDKVERESIAVLRLRGLPWSSNEREIVRFFTDHNFQVEANNIILGTTGENRLTGEAWVIFPSTQAADEARKTCNRQLIGRRYIEIFPSTLREMENARRGFVPSRFERMAPPYAMGGGRFSRGGHFDGPMGHGPMDRMDMMGGGDWMRGGGPPSFGGGPMGRGDNVHIRRVRERDNEFGFTTLRMRGLPYHSTVSHIMDFYQGFSMSAILPATVPIDGRPSGEAYVEFISADEAFRAYRTRNGATMDRRYIELFPSSKQEMDLAAAGLDPREIRQKVSTRPSTSAPRAQ